MDRLRPRKRSVFSGFTKSEVMKLEQLLKESGERVLDKEFCQNTARKFNRCVDRAGKPVLKWTEVQNWFANMREESTCEFASSTAVSKKNCALPGSYDCNEENPSSRLLRVASGKILDLATLEFEARSLTDEAWYDVDVFLDYRFTCTGEAEVLVRYIGFGCDEEEWVNIKKQVRLRSVPLEHSECHMVNVGDLVLCFQERGEDATHYDTHVLEIHRRMHDIRGCRCLFLVRYVHDNSEASPLYLSMVFPQRGNLAF